MVVLIDVMLLSLVVHGGSSSRDLLMHHDLPFCCWDVVEMFSISLRSLCSFSVMVVVFVMFRDVGYAGLEPKIRNTRQNINSIARWRQQYKLCTAMV